MTQFKISSEISARTHTENFAGHKFPIIQNVN